MLNAAMMIFAPSHWRLNLSFYFKTLQQKIPLSAENSASWRTAIREWKSDVNNVEIAV